MALKVLLITEYFFPKSTGGTELYVYNLAKALINFGNEVALLTCTDDGLGYEFDQISIIGVPFNKDQRKEIIQEKVAPDNLEDFIHKVCSFHADVVHFHTLTTSLNIFHIEKVKQLGYPVLFTSHIPGHLCLRGDLVRLNKEACDGIIKSHKCLSCFHENKGIKFPFNHLSSALIESADLLIPFSNPAKNKKRTITRLNLALDALVVVSDWQKTMFLANGFNEQKIHICRQALDEVTSIPQKKENPHFTIGFIGRASKGKGLHLLIEALNKIDQNLFCIKTVIIPVLNEMPYFQEMKEQVTAFKNNEWIENLPHQEVSNFMGSLDVLCIPSIWLETGPFVAYEAFAVGTPILGSNIGGTKELIEENKNGWSFQFNNANDLLQKIKFLIDLYQQKGTLSISNNTIRTSADMANEMIITYQKILK